MKHIEARITGRVQMVMYRDFATRKARSLGITGSVQNFPDGSVRVIAEGEESVLKGYLEKLRKGSLLSHVENVETQWSDTLEHFERFDILY